MLHQRQTHHLPERERETGMEGTCSTTDKHTTYLRERERDRDGGNMLHQRQTHHLPERERQGWRGHAPPQTHHLPEREREGWRGRAPSETNTPPT